MKPFPRRGLSREQLITNYRISRARRVVENAFGILAKRFRCILTTMELRPKKVESVVLACCCLHNILRDRYGQDLDRELDAENEDHELIQGQWREGPQLDGIQAETGSQGRPIEAGRRNRDRMMNYVNSPIGAVSWQDRMVAT